MGFDILHVIVQKQIGIKCFQKLTKEICNKIANQQKETAQDQTLSKKVQDPKDSSIIC